MRPTHLLAATALFCAPGIATPQEERSSPLFETVCATCHGPRGGGNAELKTPSIAGQPDWYTLGQIAKFRADMRGIDPSDETGAQMHAIAMTLDDQAAKEVAAYIAGLPVVPTKNTLRGDSKKGRILFEDNCMECHRYNGTGEMVFKSPSLIAYQDWYIVAQLGKFQSGARGTHPGDEEGAKMHRVTQFVRGEHDFINIAAFIAELAQRYAK
ncbi:MAG: cytochrome c [Verrucomicrobiales bacterium]